MSRGLTVWNAAKMLLALRIFQARYGRYPYFEECVMRYDLPPRPRLCAQFGSLAMAISAAGGEPPPARRPRKTAA